MSAIAQVFDLPVQQSDLMTAAFHIHVQRAENWDVPYFVNMLIAKQP
jgi:hypothetical protein